jgi:hypothetical protein
LRIGFHFPWRNTVTRQLAHIFCTVAKPALAVHQTATADCRTRRRGYPQLRRHIFAALPCTEIGLGPDLAAANLPVIRRSGAGNAEVQMGRCAARIAARTGEPQHLSGSDAHARLDTPGNLRKMRSIVAHAIIADDRHRNTAAKRRIVGGRRPPIFVTDEIHHTVGHRNERNADGTKDIGCRVIVVRR